MSKPPIKQTHIKKPFYKDESIVIGGNQKDNQITEWYLTINGKQKTFKVKNNDILGAFQQMEKYFDKKFKTKTK